MSAIDASAVSKRYQTDVPLDRVDFAVEEGETFGFLGPNGAGKSRFINMLLDFAKPTEESCPRCSFFSQEIARSCSAGTRSQHAGLPGSRFEP